MIQSICVKFWSGNNGGENREKRRIKDKLPYQTRVFIFEVDAKLEEEIYDIINTKGLDE